MESRQDFLHSNPYHLCIVYEKFTVYTYVFSLNTCNDMHWNVPVMIVFLNKYYHTYFLSSNNCLHLAVKLHHEYIVFHALDRKNVVLFIPLEGNNIPLGKIWREIDTSTSLLLWIRSRQRITITIIIMSSVILIPSGDVWDVVSVVRIYPPLTHFVCSPSLQHQLCWAIYGNYLFSITNT